MQASASVSVIVPVFNGAAHLAETLASIRAQTAPVAEIVVVDDGSTDGSIEIAERFAPAVRVIVQPNGGVCSARNAGFAASRGSLVCFVDQDDIWHPMKVARQLAVLAQVPEVGAVVCPYQHWWPSEQPDAMRAFPPDVGTVLDPAFTGWVYHQFLLDCWALTSATLLRREVIDTCGGFDPAQPYAEDWELWLRISRTWRFALLTWPPVLYRQHKHQGSRQVRETDHRTALLSSTASHFGLASRDGRSIDRTTFDTTLARYQFEFGYHHLQFGSRAIALQSLMASWWRNPRRWRPLAVALAGAVGWRPRNNRA